MKSTDDETWVHKTTSGWLGYFHCCWKADPEPVKERGQPKMFDDHRDARIAALLELRRREAPHVRGEIIKSISLKAKANELFRKDEKDAKEGGREDKGSGDKADRADRKVSKRKRNRVVRPPPAGKAKKRWRGHS